MIKDEAERLAALENLRLEKFALAKKECEISGHDWVVTGARPSECVGAEDPMRIDGCAACCRRCNALAKISVALFEDEA
jgi:hypothetical protein